MVFWERILWYELAFVRVASLLPASTEIVAALGRGVDLVGRSHECDYPYDLVKDLPILTSPCLAPRASSREIHDGIQESARRALSLYEIDEGRLKELEPELVLTQAQCEVCSVSYEQVVESATRVLGENTRVLSLQPQLWDDVLGDFLRVAEALGEGAAGARLIGEISNRVEAIEDRVALAPSPRILCVEWMDPLVVAGHWMPELIEWAGGSPLFSLPGEKSSTVEWDAVLDADPEVVIIAPCGFKLDQTCADLDALRGRPGWASLEAVRRRRVFAVDGNAYVNRPGPRLADTLEIVAALLHPEIFPLPPEDTFMQVDA